VKLATVRSHALSLGDVTEEPHHHYSSFRVRGNIFVTVPPDEAHIHVFTSEETRDQALAMFPHFIEKLLWGGKVVGIRIGLEKAEPEAVKQLVKAAFEHKALKAPARPKRKTSTTRANRG
jgi:hypothetical protein